MTGDFVKLFLIRHRIKGMRTIRHLAPTLAAETVLDFFVAGGLMVWALSIGVLPTHEVYSRLPTVDWKFLLRYEHETVIAIAVLVAASVIGLVFFLEHGTEFRARVRLGFAIFGDPAGAPPRRDPPRALSWVLRDRLRLLLPARVRRPREPPQRAARSGRRLALDALFPATPRRRRDEEQGLIVFVFHGKGISDALVLAFSVGMNIALWKSRVQRRARDRVDRAHDPQPLVAQAARRGPGRQRCARLLPTDARSTLPRVPYAAVYPLLTARAVARAFTYEVDEGVGKGAIVSIPFGRRRARGIVVGLDDAPTDGIDAVPIDGVLGHGAARASSTSPSGLPTTTARHPAAR